MAVRMSMVLIFVQIAVTMAEHLSLRKLNKLDSEENFMQYFYN